MPKLSVFLIITLIISSTPIKMIEFLEDEAELKRINGIKEDIKYVLDKMHQKELTQDFFRTYSGNENVDPGFLHFYTQDIKTKELIIHEDKETGEYTYGSKMNNPNMPLHKVRTDYMIDKSRTMKRPFIVKPSVEFVTIHDTGNDKKGADALAHAKYVTSPADKTSWHFTIDDKEIFQHLPLDEVGAHAGDGENLFYLIDTKVKADKEIPKPTISFDTKSHHLIVNGQESELMAPQDKGEYKHKITPAGLYVTIGDNGNYWINHYYYNTIFEAVSNGGGNRNSIGIETCINQGIKYSYVMRNIGTTVVRLLDEYNLKTDRVMQHRNFSGKLCPQSMIRAKEGTPFEYKNLINLIEEYYYIMKKLPGAKFTYTSKTPKLLNDDGFIMEYVTKDTPVSYEVTVEYEGVQLTEQYSTILHPKA